MEEMSQKLYQAEEWCKQNAPELYEHKADIKWIENFIYKAYTNDILH